MAGRMPGHRHFLNPRSVRPGLRSAQHVVALGDRQADVVEVANRQRGEAPPQHRAVGRRHEDVKNLFTNRQASRADVGERMLEVVVENGHFLAPLLNLAAICEWKYAEFDKIQVMLYV